jgi:hypothetical protein
MSSCRCFDADQRPGSAGRTDLTISRLVVKGAQDQQTVLILGTISVRQANSMRWRTDLRSSRWQLDTAATAS